MIPVAMFFTKTIFPLWRSLPLLVFYHYLLPVTVSGVFCTTKAKLHAGDEFMIWEEGENIFFQKLQKPVSLNDLRSRVCNDLIITGVEYIPIGKLIDRLISLIIYFYKLQ